MFVSSHRLGSGSWTDMGVAVTYSFTNRTPHMKLRRAAYKWLLEQLDSESIPATLAWAKSNHSVFRFGQNPRHCRGA
jgi:hypothetical protein